MAVPVPHMDTDSLIRPHETPCLYQSPLFNKARSEGWPADMVRAAGVSPMAAPEDIITGGALLDALDQFHLVMAWYTGFWTPSWAARRVGRGEKGYLCNLDKDAQVGDFLALVDRGRRTLVLRRGASARGDNYRIVGFAYLHGLAEGMARPHGDAGQMIWLR